MAERTNLRPVDQYGELKLQIAELTKRLDSLKAELVAAGLDVVEGDLYRVVISRSTRATLDQDAVRAQLSPQFLRAHTRYTPVTTLRVAALHTEAA